LIEAGEGCRRFEKIARDGVHERSSTSDMAADCLMIKQAGNPERFACHRVIRAAGVQAA
jgi:hypothetical protein